MNQAATRLFSSYLQTAMSLQLGRINGADWDYVSKLHWAASLDLSRDEQRIYERILSVRSNLAENLEEISIQDYGAGISALSFKEIGARKRIKRSIASVHASSAVPYHWGLFLFRLVRALNPRRVLELGTNLGVSACYIQAALDLNNAEGRLVSIEGDPTLASIAKGALLEITNSPVEIVVGRFQDVLSQTLDRLGSVDLAFIDGHHEEEPTYRYYQLIKPFLTTGAAVVFDDLYVWNFGLRRAWKRILTEERTPIAIDLLKFGILFPNGLSITTT